MKIRGKKSDDKIELMMTPMIDIVFQLLVFFVMTFKIVSPEGDFNIKMPIAAPSQGIPDDTFPPLTIRLVADANGNLETMALGQRPVGDFEQLRREIRGLVGDDAGPGSAASEQEVELDCDYNLKFENVINTITAVSGYIEGGRVIKLIEKIKFAPPRAPE